MPIVADLGRGSLAYQVGCSLCGGKRCRWYCACSWGPPHRIRCPEEREGSVRSALGIVPCEAWVVNGIPISFSSVEANSVLREMGLGPEVTVVEHTRRVFRTTQSWIVHLLPGTKPPEDILSKPKGGREFFVTLTPAALRPSTGPLVKQFSHGPRKKSDLSYADMVKGDFPPLNKQTNDRPAPDRIQNLERLISALVGLLAEGGVKLSPSVQALLHEHTSPAAASVSKDQHDDDHDDDMDSDGCDDDDDPYLGDMREELALNMPKPMQQGGPSDDRQKRARIHAAPSKDTLSLSHASSLPFKFVAWGRVKGDGNCLWRSAAFLTKTDWASTKKSALALAPSLSVAW